MILAKFHHVELWTTRFLGVAFLFAVDFAWWMAKKINSASELFGVVGTRKRALFCLWFLLPPSWVIIFVKLLWFVKGCSSSGGVLSIYVHVEPWNGVAVLHEGEPPVEICVG